MTPTEEGARIDLTAQTDAKRDVEAKPQVDTFVRNVLDRAPRMNFFQLCRVLELHAPQSPVMGSTDDPVRFHPSPSMGFPGTEVAGAPHDREGPVKRPVVRTTFHGLYGVDAAVPSHLVDDIVLRRDGHDVVMDFLDPFNHRFVTLMYRTWRKYRYPIGFRVGASDERSRDLLCLGGLGIGNKPATAGVPASRALAMLGLLQQRTRTAEGLAGVVRMAVPGFKACVEEFLPERVWVSGGTRLGCPVDDRQRRTLHGPQAGLGDGLLLGQRVPCRHRSVRITLAPLAGNDMATALPGAVLHRDLMGMLRLYLGLKVDAVLRMRVATSALPPPRLGSAGARLGWTSHLATRRSPFLTVSLGRYEALASTRQLPGHA